MNNYVLKECKKCKWFDNDRGNHFNDGSKVPHCSHPFFHYKDGNSMLDVEEEFINFLSEFKFCLFFEEREDKKSKVIEINFKK